MYIILYLNLGLFATYLTKKPCITYLCNVNDCDGCGYIKPKTVNKKSIKVSSRIINGRPTTNAYPWMATIINKVKKRLRVVPPLRVEDSFAAAVGTIITTHSIITAGHALCRNKFISDLGNGWKSDITCPRKRSLLVNPDLNVRGFNEINIEVGTVLRSPPNNSYDENIAAYLYKYVDEGGGLFSTNGDFGVVIKKKPLEFTRGILDSICLLNLELYDTSKAIDVKAAGWGLRYHEVLDPLNQVTQKTSCQTNDAKTDNRNTISTYNERHQFLDCQIPNKDAGEVQTKGFCSRDLLDSNLKTLPQDIDLVEVTGFSGPGSKLDLNNLVKNQQQIECVDYMANARAKWVELDKSIEDFDKTIDRIVIIQTKSNNRELVCYNLRKVAIYGVCLTTEAPPRHWGFCSRSCHASQLTLDEPYDEADFKYFERLPNPKDDITGNLSF